MANFIDRRLNAKGKSTVNRQRFIERNKKQIKQSVNDAITQRSVTDVETGERIKIPTKDTKEPFFHHGDGGIRKQVHPGNKEFVTGDKIPKPKQSQQGQGEGEASDSGEGEDNFIFQISRDEYLELLFEDLELPNLHKTDNSKIVETQLQRAGFTTDGVPTNINIVRSLTASLGRRIALSAGKKQELNKQKKELAELLEIPGSSIEEIKTKRQQVAELKHKIKKVPFIDTFDLRYNNYKQHHVPTSQAVMFCLMDVSGSMDQATKDIAKRFYILLYLFLTRTYENLEVVFIRHHTQAKEVDEQEFFYSQETGGTIVSSALKLMNEIQQQRFPENEWNIYVAQASDGDNWADDCSKCIDLLQQSILPICRYYSYIEITQRAHQSLWRQYEKLEAEFDNIAVQHIKTVNDIYPVFRELFKKRVV
ncbi:YeaH/YhbH family protein [Parashewanella tropica]|uniref:YeaH/YhbH family protein n=1 Tax=Parashewanella tropica TaxID=2547970 RepID=UPI00105AADFF|nr:YeaH/YhbH family protein [Parashewanella tropica]